MKIMKAVAVACLFVLTACSSGPRTSGLPPLTASMTSPDASQYAIGPGDVLDIFVWHNADLTRQIIVRPDGAISMPLIGDAVAVGRTPTALAMDIQERLKPFVRDPLVTVIPVQFVGLFTRQIRVVGEALAPKALPYSSQMTVLDVMIEVGGLTKYADGNRTVLVRMVDGKQQSYTLALDSLVRDGDVTKNVAMAPGDILIIPQRFF
jgi:polysaccharide export outer membrane protein